MDNTVLLDKLNAEQLSFLLKDLSLIEYFRGQWDILHPHVSDPPEEMLKVNAGMKEGSGIVNRDTRIAQAAYEILSEFHSGPDALVLSSNSIRSLHRQLFLYSPEDAGHRGNFRADLSEELDVILETLKNRITKKEIHVVLSVSVFRRAFLELMPFVAANARIANLLSYFLLVKNNYSFLAYYPFLEYMSRSAAFPLKELSLELPRAIADVLNESRNERSETYLNERREHLLEFISKKARPVKISDIMKYFPNESRNTIKKDIIYLKNNSLVASRGEGRGMKYTAMINNTDNL
jgi:Fic family protein